MLLTWFPDAGFKEKLTKLSFLKLSERQQHTRLYLKFTLLVQDQNICLQGQKVQVTQSTIQRALCEKYRGTKMQQYEHDNGTFKGFSQYKTFRFFLYAELFVSKELSFRHVLVSPGRIATEEIN